jgi:hypothetical protein
MKNRYCLLLLVVILFLGACELYNPKEPIPAYIRIKKINLTTQSAEGTNSHKITDAWVYVDEELIGCFELPTKFPVLKTGTHHLKIRAGIKVNGISATRSPYPFYTYFEQDINLVAGQVLDVSPSVGYISNTQFSFIEDFEGTGHIFYPRPAGTDTVLKITTNPALVFEGAGSGIVGLDNIKTFFEAVTDPSNKYILPTAGSPVFLELNYKCDHPFSVGVYGYTVSTGGTITNVQQFKAIDVNKSENWNKIYVYLSPIVTSSGANRFSVFVGCANSPAVGDITIQLDNIKLVHF